MTTGPVRPGQLHGKVLVLSHSREDGTVVIEFEIAGFQRGTCVRAVCFA